jgi:hypothetical protein
MIHQVLSVYDEKAEAYLPPFVLPTINMAIRTFMDCVSDSNHAFGKHPSDYTLYVLGDFDDKEGEYVNNKHPIITGLEALGRIKQESPDLFATEETPR